MNDQSLTVATLIATLTAARRSRGLSRKEVAALVGVDQISIMRWETGANSPAAGALAAWATALGYTLTLTAISPEDRALDPERADV